MVDPEYDTPVGKTISEGILPRIEGLSPHKGYQPAPDSPERLGAVVRWIFFIPTGVIAATVAQWLVTIANDSYLSSMCIQNTSGESSSIYIALMIIIGNLMYGAVFIYAACYVAPTTGKQRLSVILMVLFCLLYLAVLVFEFSNRDYWSVLGVSCNILGSIGMVAAIQGKAVSFK